VTEIRSILAATDLSAPARRAVDRGAGLAQAASASLALVYVISGFALDNVRRWLDIGSDPGQSIVDHVHASLRDVSSELTRHYGVTATEYVRTGRTVDELARAADEVRADVIVTGTLGAGFLRGRVIGSTAERIVRKSTRPVLLVRQSPRGPYRRVLVTIDFSRGSQASLQMAAAIAPEASFVLLHCIEPFERMPGLAGIDATLVERSRAAARDDAMQRLHALAAASRLPDGRWSATTRVGMAPWVHILSVEQEQDCDLIVIGKHGGNAVEELLLGSTTNAIASESGSDVLICTQSGER
jgi:nucleotide-binding universal stress UspA family protein